MRFACVFLLLAGALSMAQEVDMERFTVISYNVQSRPVLDDSKWKMPLIGERLKEYEIIGLQEAFRGQELLFAKCPKHGTFYEQGKRHAFKIVNSGLAIMSIYPLSDQTFVHFENEGSLENRLGSKGVMLGRIKIGDATLDFYTTHLAAGTETDSGAARGHELKQITAFIKKHSPPENAVIITGDFNCRFGGPGKILDAFLTENGLEDSMKAFNGKHNEGIDHILFKSSPKLKLKVEDCKWLGEEFKDGAKGPLSDHVPLKAIFTILKD